MTSTTSMDGPKLVLPELICSTFAVTSEFLEETVSSVRVPLLSSISSFPLIIPYNLRFSSGRLTLGIMNNSSLGLMTNFCLTKDSRWLKDNNYVAVVTPIGMKRESTLMLRLSTPLPPPLLFSLLPLTKQLMTNPGELEISNCILTNALRSVTLAHKEKVKLLALLGMSINGSGLIWKKWELKAGQLKEPMVTELSVLESPCSEGSINSEEGHLSKTESKFLPIID